MVIGEECLFIVALAMWSFLMLAVGALSTYYGGGQKFERIYDYVVKDGDDSWIRYLDYEDLEDEKELISKELEKEKKAYELSQSYIEDYKKQVSALETQIECLKAEVCTLKTHKQNKKGVI